MASNESKYMITLRSSDGKEFKVLNVVAMQSKRISSMIKDACTENGIPLHINVGSKTLAKVIKYCKKHAESNNDEEDVKVWDAEFVRVEKRKLFELILAASHLDIKGLVDLTCQTMTDLIRGMSREEARKWIIDKNDYTEQLIAFANVASGMAVNDDCNLKFLELKAIRRHRFIVYKIDGKVKHVVVEKLGEPMMSYV